MKGIIQYIFCNLLTAKSHWSGSRPLVCEAP